MPEITIREANSEDAALISVLASATFYEAYFEQDESGNLAGYISEAFDKRKIAAELSDPDVTFLIISRSGKAAGYAKLVRNSTLECIDGEKPVELKRIYILERVYGKGYGARLLEHSLKLAANKGFDTLWLQVWEENPRARRFYAKYSFRAVGKVAMPYGDVIGVNLVLEKKLA
ncbi:MAG: GNAT family N-acetyltransferase [Pyrinomonadaceae bacterium]